jgi:hypothetical protein
VIFKSLKGQVTRVLRSKSKIKSGKRSKKRYSRVIPLPSYILSGTMEKTTSLKNFTKVKNAMPQTGFAATLRALQMGGMR